ncbi:MAG: peptidyl-prolyl cis-trans isomerase SurA [Marivirga sp.]|jgi:peptidyl-prolyl cis-trans isomerase SurA
MKFTPNRLTNFLTSLIILTSFQSTVFAQKQVVDEIIAKVDNYIILESDFQIGLKEYLSRGNMLSDESKCTVIEGLVINKLLLAKAEIDSVVVEESQIDAQLDSRLSMMVNQIGSVEKIEEYYGKSLDEFKVEIRDDIKDQMVMSAMQRSITNDIQVTPSEVKKFFKNIPRDSLPFYSTQVQVGQIVKDPVMSREMKNNVKARLNGLRERILDGEDFEKVAKLYSQEPAAKSTGGNLGFFKRGELAPEYEATALRLKNGEISKPIETDFGFHIIQLIDRRGNEYNTRHILIKPSFTKSDIEVASNFLDSIRTLILNDSITFEKAAKELSDDQTTSSSGGYFLDPESGSASISVEELDPNIFFTIDTMKLGKITVPLKFSKQDGSDAIRIIYYKNRLKPHQATLDLDYQRIKQAALNKKNSEILASWFLEAKEEVYITIDEKYNFCDILK